MKEKIEEIINKYTTNYRIISISREVLPSNHNGNFVNDLYTIIQEERGNAYSSGFDDCKKLTDILVGIKKKEAVEGFVKYMERRKRSDFFINELMNEYLESEGK